MKYDFTISMALLDFVPVILFFYTAVVLQKDLYNKMSKSSYAIFSAGAIMIFIAGLSKAIWKFLYAANICDFERLNAMFFPVQSVGFILIGFAMTKFLASDKKAKKNKAYSVVPMVPPVYNGTMFFVTLMIIGTFGLCGGLAYIAKRMKKYGAMILYCISIILLLGMGYLSSKDFELASMNLIAECVNILAQLTLLTATIRLDKSGLKKENILEK